MNEHQNPQTDKELTLTEKKLIPELKRWLLDSGAITVRYSPPNRSGTDRFINIDANDGTRVVINVRDQENQNPNFIRVQWLDAGNLSGGVITLIDDPTRKTQSITGYIQHDLDPTHPKYWNDTGGIGITFSGQPASLEDVDVLITRLKNGHVNKQLTQKSLHELEHKWGASKLVSGTTNSSQKKLN